MLHFGDAEYEGLGGDYLFNERGEVADGDGDEIRRRWVGSPKKTVKQQPSGAKRQKKKKKSADGTDDGAADEETGWAVIVSDYPTTYGCNRGKSWSRAELICQTDVRTLGPFASRALAFTAARAERQRQCHFDGLVGSALRGSDGGHAPVGLCRCGQRALCIMLTTLQCAL